MRSSACSSPRPGGTRQSTFSRAREGITLIFSEALDHRRRQRHAEHRLEQDGDQRGSPPRPPRAPSRGRPCRRRSPRGTPPARASARAPPAPPRAPPAPGASLVSALSPMRGIDAWPARALGGEREAEDALLRHAHAVEAAAVVLEHLAGALVDHDVGAHLVGVLLAQPLRAVLGAGLLVGGDHELQLAGLRPPARLAPARPPRRPRPPPGSSCRARRGPRRSRRAARPTTGRPPTPPGRPARCPRGRAGTASARRTPAVSRAIRFGRPSTDDEQLDLEPGALEQLPEELLRGLLVARRVDRVEADQALEQLGGAALADPRSMSVIRPRTAPLGSMNPIRLAFLAVPALAVVAAKFLLAARRLLGREHPPALPQPPEIAPVAHPSPQHQLAGVLPAGGDVHEVLEGGLEA